MKEGAAADEDCGSSSSECQKKVRTAYGLFLEAYPEAAKTTPLLRLQLGRTHSPFELAEPEDDDDDDD